MSEQTPYGMGMNQMSAESRTVKLADAGAEPASICREVRLPDNEPYGGRMTALCDLMITVIVGLSGGKGLWRCRQLHVGGIASVEGTM